MLLVHLALWQLAAFGVVLALYNRWLINWADGSLKRVTMGTVGLACMAGAGTAAFRANPNLVTVPSFVLLAFSLGEVRRLWLRHRYRVLNPDAAAAPSSSLARPVTTTDLTIVRYTVATNLGPARIRIVQLTDLHFSRALPANYFAEVREAVRREAPDVIVLTGDFVSNIDNVPFLDEWLRDLPKAPLGTFAVLGNHDYWAKAAKLLRAVLAEHGIQRIIGRCERLPVSSSRHLVVCGTEAPWGPSGRLERVDPNDFVIQLSHTPDNVYASSTQVDVMFAGHYHGGQWRLPWLGALVIPSRYGRRLDRGQFQIGRTRLFVSSGIGVDAPHLRLYCPPEIVVVDLV